MCSRPAWRPFVREPSVGDPRGPRSADREGRQDGRTGRNLPPFSLCQSGCRRGHVTSSTPTFLLLLLLFCCSFLCLFTSFLHSFHLGSSLLFTCVLWLRPLVYLNPRLRPATCSPPDFARARACFLCVHLRRAPHRRPEKQLSKILILTA